MGLTRKEWLDNKSKKYNIKKRNKKYNPNKTSNNLAKTPKIANDFYNVNWGFYTKDAPTIFSFIKNTDYTIMYFNDIINEIRNGKFKQTFFIDSANVCLVTTDALVYIIAIIHNIKLNRIKRYSFKGNLPNIERAKKTYLESGFFNYVELTYKELPKSNEKMQIVTGKVTDQSIAKQMCLFVMQKLDENRAFTTTLFKTLIELMSNAVHHAYNDDDELMFPCWYLYAEHIDNKVQFIFIDTGLGIANTVRKNFWEIVKLKKNTDSDLIESAFNGEFRTETKQKNRGLGLPAIKNFVVSGKLSNFFVLSGKGICKLYNEGNKNNLTKIENNNRIYGTIYSFEITGRSE
ncbi:ATP-binding protein [Anaerocolumna sp. MB42-C2]|uniref:ATP-binding protein n=1 Tax=Anaerocolumna sp. MB42-C2 TaxID=3070997 RepID=UPI0027DFA1E2|nr:ATP-binding protein [Anaerocolumna sp. MB42-C2]WMJ88881.1 ATP-binding protein [Anaerocolumna sp. MB42-C2]